MKSLQSIFTVVKNIFPDMCCYAISSIVSVVNKQIHDRILNYIIFKGDIFFNICTCLVLLESIQMYHCFQTRVVQPKKYYQFLGLRILWFLGEVHMKPNSILAEKTFEVTTVINDFCINNHKIFIFLKIR